MALSMVWVAVGAFTLRAVVSLFFGENFGYYDVGGQAFGSFGSGSGSGSSSGCADGFSVSTDNGHGVCVSNTLIGDVVNGAGNLLSGSGA